jgi:hypothetical protein
MGFEDTPVGEQDGLCLGARDDVIVVVKLGLQAVENPVAAD